MSKKGEALADWIDALWVAGNEKACAIVKLAEAIEALLPIDGTAELRRVMSNAVADLTLELNADMGHEWRMKRREEAE